MPSGVSFKTKGSRSTKKRSREPPPKRIAVQPLPEPVKSDSDKKSYKTIRLPNGLTALLVSDPSVVPPKPDDESDRESDDDDDDDESERESDEEEDEDEDEEEVDDERQAKQPSAQFEDKAAACALCVRVGSFSDPPEAQGLAHFVEHMVFMGSRKYPRENEFDAFIRKKGGSDNAHTDTELTVFHFEVQENHLAEAMDRFAQFFVAPLMKQEAMQRERESIESEFALALPSDDNRRDQILCSAFPAGHPLRKFMWGNHKSLTSPVGPPDEELHAAAHRFRERYYSARNMTVAVQARLPIDALEKYVSSTFGQIPTNDTPSDDFSRFSYALESVPEDFHRFYYVKPVMQTTNLTLTWCMKSFRDEYKCKPHHYVAWIVGHEGTGSLLAYLKRRVWALELYSGVSDEGIDHTSVMSMFSLSVVLTQEGLKNVDRVVDAIFGYVNMLKENCPNERIFREIKQINEINFKFKEELQPCDNVEHLVENMQFLPPEHYISGDILYYEYDPKEITYVIDHLRPDKVNIILQAHINSEQIEYDETEEWFGTQFKKVDIPKEDVERWTKTIPEKEFHLPEPNPFIPNDFDLITPPPHILAMKQKQSVDEAGSENKIKELKLELVYPELVKKSEKLEVWCKPDYRFDLPMTNVIMYLITPLSVESAKTACLLDLWCVTLNQLLTERLYPADVTGLYKALWVEQMGLSLKLYGFSQKLPVVIDEIMQIVVNYETMLNENLYNALKDVQIKRYTNKVMKPNHLVKEIRLSIITDYSLTTLEKLKAMKDVAYDDLKDFGKRFLSKLYVKMLMQGNLTETNSVKIASLLENSLNWGVLSESERPKPIVYQVPLGEKHCRIKSFNSKDENSVITNYYQFGVNDLKSYCILELIMLIMEEPLFDVLRTKEQLGYNVYNSLRYTDGILGFAITVNCQAKKYCTGYIDTRIEEFLREFLKSIEELSNAAFEQFKTTLVKIKNGVDVELKDEIRRHWSEISSSEYQFNKLVLEIECIKTLKLDEVKTWLSDQLKSGNGGNFRKLSTQIVGHVQNDSMQHVEKKAKLNEEVMVALNECDYNVSYENVTDSENDFISNIVQFKDSLVRYPEIKNIIPKMSEPVDS